MTRLIVTYNQMADVVITKRLVIGYAHPMGENIDRFLADKLTLVRTHYKMGYITVKISIPR